MLSCWWDSTKARAGPDKGIEMFGIELELAHNRTQRRPLVFSLAGLALWMLLLSSAAAALRAAPSAAHRVMEGKLIFVSGTGPALESQGKRYPLAGRNQYIFHTLADKRLRNDEVRLTGSLQTDGAFQVDEFYTIHHGELYRVRYYCETCNIAALEPGRCVCCQQPTELQEVPLNKGDQKVLITH